MRRNRKLTVARERAGLSVTDLAGHASVSPDYLRKLERGDREGGIALWLALSQALGVSLDSLADESSETVTASGGQHMPVTSAVSADGWVVPGATGQFAPMPSDSNPRSEAVVADAAFERAAIQAGDLLIVSPGDTPSAGSIVLADVSQIDGSARRQLAVYIEAAGFPVLAPCGVGQSSALPLDGATARVYGVVRTLVRGYPK